MARGLLGRDHALHMHHRRRQALKESDCVLLAGVPCDFRLDYGRHIGSATTLIVANRSRKEALLNRRPNILACGDTGQFLKLIADKIDDSKGNWKDWTAKLHSNDTEGEQSIEKQASVNGEFVNPVAFLQEVERTAGDSAIFIADGGDFAATASYIIRPRGPLTWLDPGVFGTLGAGAGFALAAALNYPLAEVWIIYGDGSCGYSLMEFDTFVRHKIPVIAVVGNDASWQQIAREQVTMLGDDVGTVLARTDYHNVASALGATGILVKTAIEIAPALSAARVQAQTGKPVLINVWLNKTEFRQGSVSM
jgi:acetolactate synthase-1/2/3 large subunit